MSIFMCFFIESYYLNLKNRHKDPIVEKITLQYLNKKLLENIFVPIDVNYIILDNHFKLWYVIL